MPSPNFRASGVITTASFVKVDASNDNSVLQAGSGDRPIGVSMESAQLAPFGSNSTAAATAAGDEIRVYGQGEICNLTAGSGGFTVGDMLKPDANGNGLTTVTANDLIGAVALETTAAGAQGRVYVVFGKV
jgi:hypothetical protein